VNTWFALYVGDEEDVHESNGHEQEDDEYFQHVEPNDNEGDNFDVLLYSNENGVNPMQDVDV
jgi:hypothetical protein